MKAREPRRSRPLALRRIRAVLAGGLVLGVGATGTLAAWTDPEQATATFTAGVFGIQGSTDGGATWADHPTTPAALTFSAPATAMLPGDTVYAAFSVRTTANSVAGRLQLTAGSGNGAGLGGSLRYGVAVVPDTTCGASTFAAATKIVAVGSVLTAGAPTTQAVAAAGAGMVTYCFAVTLPATTGNAAQGTGVTASWTITGTTP